MSFAERVKELGATVLILGLATFFVVKYMPNLMKQQGTLEEVIKHSARVIENCTEAMRMVSSRDEETRDSLNRIEKRVDDINLDVHEIKANQQQNRRD